MSEQEHAFGLDGSANDFSTYIDGDKLDSKSALLLERELQNDEQNLPARLKLLFYYSQDHVDNVEPWVLLMLWMVKNRPKDWLSGNLQKPCGLSEAQFLQIKEQWSSVINSNPDDADIIGRAGQFISGRDLSAAEILLKTAQTLDKENICWSRMLTYNYMWQAEVGTSDQKAEYTELTFESADATLLKEQHDGEKNGMLTALCEFSLTMGDTKRAHYYADALKKHVDHNGLKHQLFQAYCFLGRAALLDEDTEVANNCLIQASKCGYFPDLDLADALLQRGERKTVLFFFKMCLASACEDRAIVSDWVRQIENNQTPTLAI